MYSLYLGIFFPPSIRLLSHSTFLVNAQLSPCMNIPLFVFIHPFLDGYLFCF